MIGCLKLSLKTAIKWVKGRINKIKLQKIKNSADKSEFGIKDRPLGIAPDRDFA